MSPRRGEFKRIPDHYFKKRVKPPEEVVGEKPIVKDYTNLKQVANLVDYYERRFKYDQRRAEINKKRVKILQNIIFQQGIKHTTLLNKSVPIRIGESDLKRMATWRRKKDISVWRLDFLCKYELILEDKNWDKRQLTKREFFTLAFAHEIDYFTLAEMQVNPYTGLIKKSIAEVMIRKLIAKNFLSIVITSDPKCYMITKFGEQYLASFVDEIHSLRFKTIKHNKYDENTIRENLGIPLRFTREEKIRINPRLGD